ncbi:site-specific integrase [Tardiphaga robiniae]|uniref:site-specific integrase n=1 Tax=Tardiphaga robiniae TaxID=943830 RepID=UPI0015869A62|nr:hypothetical protein [Tardiphaga robiniae]
MKTDATCVIAGRSYNGLPTLVWAEGIDEAASDWLRHIVIRTGAALSSAYEYAKILRPFLRFCRVHGRPWDGVDDEFLVLWREKMRRTDGIDAKRINTVLIIVFAFYRWAEETGRLRFHVGIYDAELLPHYVQLRNFPITAEKIFSKGKRGRVITSWTTPLTMSVSQSSQGKRHTPNDHEAMRIHEVAADREFGERDTLMYSWAEEVGTRRAEILSLRKKDLPKQADVMRDNDGHVKWPIKVVRKGGATWTVLAPTDLVLATWDWIFLGRADMVERCRKSILGYQEPQEIFISSRTGMPLDEDSLTTLAKRDFAVANVEKASLHRLRAKYCVEQIQTLVDSLFEGGLKVGATSSWVETILTIVAERMGHMSPMSLRPYLNQVLDRKIRTAEASLAQSMKSSIRILNNRRKILRRTVDLNLHLRDIAESIDRGDAKKTSQLIRQLQVEVDEFNGLPEMA